MGDRSNIRRTIIEDDRYFMDMLCNHYAALQPRAKSTRRHPRSIFTPEEDERLRLLVERYKHDWEEIARQLPGRNVRQCKERWMNYLSPQISLDPWTDAEDRLLLEKATELGPKWVRIARFFPNRTDINVKSRWFRLMRRNRKLGSPFDTVFPLDLNPELGPMDSVVKSEFEFWDGGAGAVPDSSLSMFLE
jgi:hypothetical protein